MSSIEKRIEDIERRQKMKNNDSNITWILFNYEGEARPTKEEIKEAEAAYIEKFGKPEGVTFLDFSHGVSSAKGVELTRYKYEAVTMGNRTFKEILSKNE